MYSKGIDLKLEPIKNVVKELKNFDEQIHKKEIGQKINDF